MLSAGRYDRMSANTLSKSSIRNLIDRRCAASCILLFFQAMIVTSCRGLMLQAVRVAYSSSALTSRLASPFHSSHSAYTQAMVAYSSPVRNASCTIDAH